MFRATARNDKLTNVALLAIPGVLGSASGTEGYFALNATAAPRVDLRALSVART